MAEPDKSGAKAPAVDLVDGTVAPRHTVQVNGKSYGPGATVSLPRAEVKELRAAGFLVLPGAPVIAASQGPVYEAQPAVINLR